MKRDKNVIFMIVVVLAGVLLMTYCDGGKGEGEVPGSPSINLYYVANREVGIIWDVVDNAESYNLYWNNTGGVSTSDNSITNLHSSYVGIIYNHSSLSLFKTYYYMVTAVNTAGESPPSNELSVVPVSVPQEYQKIISSDYADMDYFGFSTSMSGENIIVGAPNKDDGGSDSGAAYVFIRYEEEFYWGELKKITASDAQAGDEFGTSVAISGDYAIVGAHYQDSGGSDRGAAYIFNKDLGGTENWGEVKKLTASSAQDLDEFGTSVAISGDYAIVGAQYEDSGGTSSGAAYVFYRDQGGADNWGQVVKLTASDAEAGDEFGSSVAIDGDYVVSGAIGEDSGGTDRGAAYIFYRNQGGTDNWGEVLKLTASDPEDQDAFGGSVAIDGEFVVVGAFYEDGDEKNNRGAAYIYGRNSGGQDVWGQVIKILASDAGDGDNFGFSVAIEGNFVVIAVPYEETEGNTDRGAVYIF